MRIAQRKKTRAAVAAVGAVASAVALGNDGAGAVSYGQAPKDTIWNQAGAYSGCGMTRNKMTAMMFAISANEGGPFPSPPMSHGRFDVRANSAYDGTASNTGAREVFFSPGIGLWQYDFRGLGQSRAAWQAIDVPSVVASAESTALSYYNCNAGTNPFASAVSNTWAGCGSGACNATFNSIYTASTDSLSYTPDSSIDNKGGMAAHSCTKGGGSAFTCYLVSISSAQGSSGWRNPSFGTNPLPFDYFSWLDNAGNEVRFWPTWKTSMGSHVQGYRSLSGTNVTWSTSGSTFCDTSTGICA